MDIPPFLLDRWFSTYEFASPPIKYNLGASTGPVWTLGELLALGDGTISKQLDALRVSYAPGEGARELREQIAEFHGVDPDWVVVTTGASEALSALYWNAAQPGGSIVFPSPGYPAFNIMARAWGLSVRTYTLEREQRYEQTAAAVLAAIDSTTRLVLVNTPHQPTGSVMPRTELSKLADALADRGIPLLVDEVYHPLYFDQVAASAANLPNTIVVGDLSKALSLSGLRIGWVIDRNAARREQLIDARSYFTISGSPITELLATHALKHRTEILSRLSQVARANLASCVQFMNDNRSTLGWIPPKGSSVVFPWRLDGRDTRPMCEALARAGVLVAPGYCFGVPEHFRLGFGAQAHGFRDALFIASEVIRSLR